VPVRPGLRITVGEARPKDDRFTTETGTFGIRLCSLRKDSQGSPMTTRVRIALIVAALAAAVLTLLVGQGNTVRTAESQLAIFEQESSRGLAALRRPKSVVVVEPKTVKPGTMSWLGTPTIGDMIDLSTGDTVRDWHVVRTDDGVIWESTNGVARRLSGGVLYNLTANPAYPIFGLLLLAIACGLAPGLWSQDATGRQPRTKHLP
jgi:hypothetical protein